MMFTVLLAAAAVVMPTFDEQTRPSMLAQYRAVIIKWDRDNDKRLSSAEIDTMVKTGLRNPTPQDADGQARFAEAMRQFYMSQDANEDGFVGEDELLSGASKLFDCQDLDKGDTVSLDEIRGGVGRCSAL
jgi:hypothetical protein